MIALGREQPLLRFTVEADPPSVYVVYRARPDAVADLDRSLGLAAHLRPTPIRCLEHDERQHLVVLNVYRVSGLANGLRAEWSTFVADDAGVARYAVFDARSSQVSMDPVDVITRASTVEHARTGSTITTQVGDDPSAWRGTIEVPDGDGAPLVSPAPEWAGANDYIYWANGICDRTWYDSGMHDPRVRRVPVDSVTIDDRTRWAPLVEPEPLHVLVFEDRIELAITPWENLDRIRA